MNGKSSGHFSNGTSPYDLVIVCPHLGDGGTQRVVTTLANSWSRQGRRICVITLFRNEAVYQLDAAVDYANVQNSYAGKLHKPPASILDKTKQLVWDSMRFVGIDEWVGKYYHYYQLVMYLRKTLRRYDTPMVVSFIGSTNLMTILACRGLGKQVVISERNDPARQRLESPWNGLRPLLYNRANVVTANTDHALQTMRRYVKRDKLVFVPNPLLPKSLKNGSPHLSTNEGPYILTVGRLHPQKAHDILLKAFSLLPASMGHWRLLIIGQGELSAELRRMADELGISERIVWLGQVENPFPYYRAAQIFALPSRHEGMSNALIEAMSCGLPAVVSDACPGSLELIRDSENGLVVPVDDPPALAEALTCLAENEALRIRLGKEAKAQTAEYELTKVLKK